MHSSGRVQAQTTEVLTPFHPFPGIVGRRPIVRPRSQSPVTLPRRAKLRAMVAVGHLHVSGRAMVRARVNAPPWWLPHMRRKGLPTRVSYIKHTIRQLPARLVSRYHRYKT